MQPTPALAKAGSQRTSDVARCNAKDRKRLIVAERKRPLKQKYVRAMCVPTFRAGDRI